jgi:transposase IS4-like protein/DDE family transposase
MSSMSLDAALAGVATFARPDSVDRFRQDLDPEWLEDALRATGTATLRRRRLPAEQVVWLVLGMALFRDRSIVEVVNKLDLALPDARGRPVASSAVPKARARVGPEPLAWLFARCAEAWAVADAAAHRWRGLALYGVDGTALRVPDTPANRAHFGGHPAGNGRGESAYPLARVVALMALRSHLLAAAAFGPWAAGEPTYARALWAHVPDDSLTVVDRGFLAAGPLLALAAGGANRHWLVRAKANTRLRLLAAFGAGDALVEMRVSAAARRADPALPAVWRARAIGYQRPGRKPQVLLTSLLDPVRYPAAEVIALYHERWEMELAYDELKTEMLAREEAIRSQSPAAVTQELWGLLLAYNLVRLEMARAAAEAGVAPTRVSFVGALWLIRDEWLWCAVAAPGAIPRHLRALRAALTHLILPERRSAREYPRHVKLRMTGYPRKRDAPTRAPGRAKTLK